jgi:hypothetical protein
MLFDQAWKSELTPWADGVKAAVQRTAECRYEATLNKKCDLADEVPALAAI